MVNWPLYLFAILLAALVSGLLYVAGYDLRWYWFVALGLGIRMIYEWRKDRRDDARR